MPYIEAGRREKFDNLIDSLVKKWEFSFNIGEINYCLSRIIWKLWEVDRNYEAGNELVGVLECVKQEFYRRQVAPYEDEKRALNGDIV